MSSSTDLAALAHRVDLLALRLEDLTEAFHNFRLSVGRDQHLGGYQERSPPSEASSVPGQSAGGSSSVYNRLAEEIPAVSEAAVTLCSRLSGGALTLRQRAVRAWESGWWAKFCLEGRVARPRPSRPIDLSNSVYVVLRAEGHDCPLLFNRASDYRAVVRDFQEGTISHGFPSLAEAKVYCIAAGVICPATYSSWTSTP